MKETEHARQRREERGIDKKDLKEVWSKVQVQRTHLYRRQEEEKGNYVLRRKSSTKKSETFE